MKHVTVVFKDHQSTLSVHADPVLDTDAGVLFLFGATPDSRVTLNFTDISYFHESPLDEDGNHA